MTADPLTKHQLKLIVLSGRSGSGKSSTAYEICHILKSQKIPHTHIDGDNLDTFYPGDDNSNLMLLNLKSMWSIYYSKTQELWRRKDTTNLFVIVLSGTGLVLDLESISGVFSEVVNDGMTGQVSAHQVNLEASPIILQAGDDIVKSRLTLREIGGELDEHLQSTERMSQILNGIVNDRVMRFRTDYMSVTDVASKILVAVNIVVL